MERKRQGEQYLPNSARQNVVFEERGRFGQSIEWSWDIGAIKVILHKMEPAVILRK